jgi:ribosomal protein S12 methylthiotransferase accessory factor
VSAKRPVVFLGPSMSATDARRLLSADYRPPVRRGDLSTIESGRVVAIIDGVFDQDLAVSPGEILEALQRGVTIFGGASMGALRAAEIPGVFGVGRIYSWYRTGLITRDDEVALVFEDETYRPLTVPTVNIRHAIDRLSAPGTIDRTTAERLLTATLELHFKARTYSAILRKAGLANQEDSADLIAMLQTHDLKRLDAQSVLEAVDNHIHRHNQSDSFPATEADSFDANQNASPHADGTGILVWESGDRVGERELFDFLIFTGRIQQHARRVQMRSAHPEPISPPSEAARVGAAEPQSVLDNVRRRWGWLLAEEAKVTLADLSLDRIELSAHCTDEARSRNLAFDQIRLASPQFVRAVLTDLFISDLALKREVMRLAGLLEFARRTNRAVDPADLAEAQTVLCKANGEYSFRAVRRLWARCGVEDAGQQDAFVEVIAKARKSSRGVAAAMKGATGTGNYEALSNAFDPSLRPCLKPDDELRFCLPMSAALSHTSRLREVIGITRVGMIGELADISGIQIAQAARPNGEWSSSYGSGKSLTAGGAIVGSVMEEIEKWTQERFAPSVGQLVKGAYADVEQDGRFVDPATLDLPYDSTYRPHLPLDWVRCADLLNGGSVYVPADVVLTGRRKHDITYSERGSCKCLTTNGLASGFRREEALLHAVCEYVERHAARIADLYMANPGGLGCIPYRFVDLKTMPQRLQDLAGRLSDHDTGTVRVLNITSDVAIPTFQASAIRGFIRLDGYGTHPNPEVAIEMALLEAAQTIATNVAGGREDLSIQVRSLGRHERPRPISIEDVWFWLDPDTVYESLGSTPGLASNDVCDDLRWSLERIRDAGLATLPALDMTLPETKPAHVVRVLLPGLESNNPFYTGDRARLVLLHDLLPRWR